jgi:uncharacterized protein YkwD
VKPLTISIFLILFSFTLGVFSLNDPTDAVRVSCPEAITIPSGGNAEIKVELTIPAGNYIFLEHLSDNGAGRVTTFSLHNTRGFAITDIKKPAGEKQKNEVVLFGKGEYTLHISDTEGHSPGTTLKTGLEIITQLCNKKNGVCYFPRTIKRDINIEVTGFSWSAKDYDTHTYTSFANIPQANSRIDFEHIDYPLLHAAIFYETNRQRVLNGRKVFSHSPALEKAAKGHSDDMVNKNFFSHTSPVKGKETMVKRLALAGVTGGYKGENIAISFGIEYKAGKSVYSPKQNGGYFSYTYKGKPIKNHTYLGLAKEVLHQWMTSPGHRANILNAQFTYLGTGASHYKNTGFFGMDNFKCTQNFGSVKGPAGE